MPLNQKGFAHLLILLVLLVGIGVGIILIKNPQVLKSRANLDQVACRVGVDKFEVSGLCSSGSSTSETFVIGTVNASRSSRDWSEFSGDSNDTAVYEVSLVEATTVLGESRNGSGITLEGFRAAFGARRGEVRYESRYDANSDGVINIQDFSTLIPVLRGPQPTTTPVPTISPVPSTSPIPSDLSNVRTWIGHSGCSSCRPGTAKAQGLKFSNLKSGQTYKVKVYPGYVSSSSKYIARVLQGEGSVTVGAEKQYSTPGYLNSVQNTWDIAFVPQSSSLTLVLGNGMTTGSHYMGLDAIEVAYPASAGDGRYREVKYKCYGGPEKSEGGSTSCKSTQEWRRVAEGNCQANRYCVPSTPSPTSYRIPRPSSYMPFPNPTPNPTAAPSASTISGSLFIDYNGDGIQSPACNGSVAPPACEPLWTDQSTRLTVDVVNSVEDGGSGSITQTVQNSASGTYSFSNLRPKIWVVRVRAVSGYKEIQKRIVLNGNTTQNIGIAPVAAP